MSVASEILARSPSSYWKLNEPSGTSFADEMGAATGTAAQTPSPNQPSLVPGDTTGTSVLFANADGDGIDLTNAYDFTATASFTAYAWLKPVAFNTGTGHYIWSNSEASTHGWHLLVGNPAVTWFLRRGDAAGFDTVQYGGMSEATYENGVAKQVAMIYNGTNLRLNIDGVDVADSASSKSVVAPVTNTVLRFGAYAGGGSGYDGYADDLAIFPTALTEAQLAAIFAASGGQTLLPDADLATTGWTATPLFSKINDSSDATLITSTAA